MRIYVVHVDCHKVCDVADWTIIYCRYVALL